MRLRDRLRTASGRDKTYKRNGDPCIPVFTYVDVNRLRTVYVDVDVLRKPSTSRLR